jgi:hypothetical protein
MEMAIMQTMRAVQPSLHHHRIAQGLAAAAPEYNGLTSLHHLLVAACEQGAEAMPCMPGFLQHHIQDLTCPSLAGGLLLMVYQQHMQAILFFCNGGIAGKCRAAAGLMQSLQHDISAATAQPR